VRIKAGNQLSEDAKVLDLGTGYSLTETDGHIVLSGAERPPQFMLVTDGTTVTAYDQAGLVVASGTDGGAVLTACLPAASAVGALIEFRNDGNVFPWSTVPALPKSITNRLLLRGNGATVQLSASAPRFVDYNRTADYDTFQNIEFDGFVIDANSIGGQHHVFGCYVAGNNASRINFQSIKHRNIRIINLLNDSNTGTNHRRGFCYVTTDAGGGSAQTIKDISFEGCRVEGGNTGFEVATAGSTSTNTTIDRVTVRDCWHDTGTTATTFYGSANIQVGGYGPVGKVFIENFYGANSGDVGIEIDNAEDATMIGVQLLDSFTCCFYATNFTAVANPKAQAIRYIACQARKINLATAAQGRGWNFGGNGDNEMGSLELTDCTWLNTTANFQDGDALRTDATHPTTGFRQLKLHGFKVAVTAVDATINSTTRQAALLIQQPSAGGTMAIDMADCHVYLNLTRHAGSGSSWFTNAMKVGTGAGTYMWNVKGLVCDITQANAVATAMQVINFGGGGGVASTHRGSWQGLQVVATSGDTAAIGVRFDANMTFDRLTFTGCDFAGLPSGGTEFSFATSTDKNLVQLRSNRWRTKPAPGSLASLATGTGKALGTGWDAMATFTQGSGTSITAIDYSTDGGTTYTNFLTQASGALPAGFDQSLGALTTDALIKVTFTGTQPTITLVPVNP
jgi:hypothetical protein